MATRWTHRFAITALILGFVSLCATQSVEAGQWFKDSEMPLATGIEEEWIFGAAAIVLGVLTLVLFGLARRGQSQHRLNLNDIQAAIESPTPAEREIPWEDVLGAWRFYVDAAMCMVTIELQPDGRYRQRGINHVGGSAEYSSGTWKLDGPYLELSNYRSMTRSVAGRACWFFGDLQNVLVLFAKDDPQSEHMLIAQKQPQVSNP
jgi:hypothetical protein